MTNDGVDDMSKSFRIQVFGKAGCDKCKTLNQRLDKMLANPEWDAFDKEYCDVMTVEGLIPFCEAECINPHRIPALLVTRRDKSTGVYEPVPNPQPGEADEICGRARLHQYVGLQTDYTTGGGVITPKMIAAVLSDALHAAVPTPA